MATNPAGKVLQFSPGQRSGGWPFAEAFEHAPNGMALLDNVGVITEANIAFCKMLGFARTELVGTTLSAITHPDDAQTEAQHRKRLADSEIDRYQLAQRFIREDGVPLWVLLCVSACRRSSEAAEYYVVQLETSGGHLPVGNGAAPDALAYRVGEALHEIGNALTPLMVSTQLIVEESKGGEINDSAHVIFNAAKRIAFTLRRLRDIETSHSMAYLGLGRMLDLRMVAPPED